MGRTAAGVRAIRLENNDLVVGAEVVVDPEADLLLVTSNGFAKRTSIVRVSASIPIR